MASAGKTNISLSPSLGPSSPKISLAPQMKLAITYDAVGEGDITNQNSPGNYVPIPSPTTTPPTSPEEKEAKPARSEIFAQLLSHTVRPKRQRSDGDLVLKYTILLLAAGLCTILYYEPAYDNGIRRNRSQFNLWMEIIGNMLTAALVTFNVGKVYWNYREDTGDIQQNFDSKFIDQKKIEAEKSETRKIVACSSLSAVPLAGAAVQTSTWPLGWTIFKVIVIQLVYTLNHNLPIHLLLHDERTRKVMFALFALLIYSAIRCQRRNLTDEELRNLALQQLIKEDINELKSAFRNTFLDGVERIYKAGSDELFAIRFGADIKARARNFPKNVTELEEYLKYLGHYPALAPPGRAGKTTRSTLWFIGATLMTLAVIGFMASGYNEVGTFAGKILSAILNILPIYFTAVITIYFGGNRLQGAPAAIPLPAKLNPKSTALLSAIATFLSAYSAGSAMELAYLNFSGWIRDALVDVTQAGLPLFTAANLWDMIGEHVRNRAKKTGSDDEKLAVEIFEQANRFALGVEWLDPKEFVGALKELSEERRGIFLRAGNISEERFKDLTDPVRREMRLEERLRTNQQSYWCCQSAFLPPPRFPRATPSFSHSQNSSTRVVALKLIPS